MGEAGVREWGGGSVSVRESVSGENGSWNEGSNPTDSRLAHTKKFTCIAVCMNSMMPVDKDLLLGLLRPYGHGHPHPHHHTHRPHHHAHHRRWHAPASPSTGGRPSHSPPSLPTRPW